MNINRKISLTLSLPFIFAFFLLNAHTVINEEIEYPNIPQDSPIILPEVTPFFPTMLAQPHIIGYSVGFRTNDRVFKSSCIPVSIGDQFSLYRFPSAWGGEFFIGMEACVWGVFEARSKSLSLLNADYFVALPLTYIQENFSLKIRLFHESSHLGDEFIIENPEIERFNPSMEVLDLALAYQLVPPLTLFVGYSLVVRSDESFPVRPTNLYYGFNYHLSSLEVRLWNIKASPYVAAYFTNCQNHNWRLNASFAVGYEWDSSFCHKLRLYLEGHTGFSEEGQFSKQKTKYLQLKLLYAY